MAAFTQLIWEHIDVWAIAGMGGLATIEEERREACRSWLSRNGYSLDTLDCTQPLNQVAAALHTLLRWEEQFGYTPEVGRRSLDALRDGFAFDIPEDGGHVLELLRGDLVWQEDPVWVRGVLSIAQEYSRWQLALGRRFFVLLVVAAQSPMIGDPIEEARVPGPFWDPNREFHHFER